MTPINEETLKAAGWYHHCGVWWKGNVGYKESSGNVEIHITAEADSIERLEKLVFRSSLVSPRKS